MSTLEIITKEINSEITKPEIANALLTTTFKGLTVPVMKEAIMAGMIRGFTFKDFLEKNIYAIPYGSSYSLITSIDYARKIGMRSGVVGISKPIYEIGENGNILSCEITVKRKMQDGYIGEYTALVDFKEYTTGKNQWLSKPKTMIAKVAEMHSLRKACPEELSQAYVEEEKEVTEVVKPLDITIFEIKLKETKNIDELKKVWSEIPVKAKKELETLKEKIKKTYDNK